MSSQMKVYDNLRDAEYHLWVAANQIQKAIQYVDGIKSSYQLHEEFQSVFDTLSTEADRLAEFSRIVFEKE